MIATPPRRSRYRPATSPGAAGTIRRLPSDEFDLIFVTVSVAHHVAHVRRARPWRHGFAEVLEYAHHKPFPSPGYRWEALGAAEEKSGAASILHRDHAAEWETLKGYGSTLRVTGFPMAWTMLTSVPRTNPTIPTRSPSSGGWTTTLTRTACSSSAGLRSRSCGERVPRSSSRSWARSRRRPSKSSGAFPVSR
jgi:hypothetical protein